MGSSGSGARGLSSGTSGTARISGLSIAPAADLEELVRLEGLVRRIFGAGDRPPGWFRRKLLREVVAPELSLIARGRRGGPVLGYILVGAPASLPGVARTAGLGVVARFRRQGIGRALVDAAAECAKCAGLDSLQSLAEPPLVGFYRALGFVVGGTQHTLLAGAVSGEECANRAHPHIAGSRFSALTVEEAPPVAWSRPGAVAVGGWLEEAWERTPAALRATYRLGDPQGPAGWALISREGRAWLIHRLLVAGDAPPATATILGLAEALRRALCPRGPLLFYGLPAGDPVALGLRRGAWVIAQEALLLRRGLVDGALLDRGRLCAPSSRSSEPCG